MSRESRIRSARLAEPKQPGRRTRRITHWGTGAAAIVATASLASAVLAGTAPLATAGGTTASEVAANGAAPYAGHLQVAPLSTLGRLQPAPSYGALGAEGVPVPSAPPLAGTASAVRGQTVDGVSCYAGEQLVYHVHARLTIFVHGTQRQVPAGIGIPGAQATQTPDGPFIEDGTCFYWLHTHAPDGIIHIESPVQRTYTLGDFFDEWGQPLSRGQAGPARGPVTALYNRQAWTGNPRDIPLTAHAQIQLEVGNPLIAPEQISFPDGL